MKGRSMKKTALFTAAVMMLSFTACDKKKTDTDTELPTEEVIGEVTAETAKTDDEPVFREFKQEDFKSIDVNVNTTEDAPPTDLHSADLSGISFGERYSPCKEEGVRENYGKYLEYKSALENNMNERYRPSFDEIKEEAEKMCAGPYEGDISYCVMVGDKFYITVNYDNYCRCHDSSLFELDPVTLEYEEVDTRTGLEYHGCYDGLCTENDKLYYYECYNTTHDGYSENGDEYKSTVYSFDPASRETTELLSLDEQIVSIFPMKSALEVHILEDVNEGNRHYSGLATRKYDYETGELLEKDDSVEEYSYESGRKFYCDGEPVEISGGYNGNVAAPLVIKTQYYSIATDLKQSSQVFAWKDRVSILNTEMVDYGKRDMSLYTYDLNTMECTRMVVNGYFNNAQKGKDGIFVTYQSSEGWMHFYYNIYYLMPQYGTLFKIDKTDDVFYVSSEEQQYYLTIERAESNGNSIEQQIGKPKTLYWFDTKE